MDVFTFACIVAIAGMLTGCYKATMRHRSKDASSEVKETLTRINDRLDRIERRTSDLETLMIDREKERKYESL
jgi:ubiquinone biosynthesis protein COQ9